MVILNWLEVGVIHCISGSYSLGVVVLEHLREQVNCLVCDELVVLRSDEFGPRLTWMVTQNIVVMRVQLHAILLHVAEQFISAKDLCDLYKLIVVVLTLEEGLFLENHTGKHATQ